MSEREREIQITKARMAILQAIPERWRYDITRAEAHALATAAVDAAMPANQSGAEQVKL